MTWVEKAVSSALADWENGVSEKNRSSLDAIFREVGWSPGAPPKPAHVPDWCGFAVGAWMLRAGMVKDHRRSFYHTKNVEAFFTYGESNNVNPKRLMQVAFIEGRWERIKTVHERKGNLRLWIPGKDIRRGKYEFRPGDVVLINHSGSLTTAHHITMALMYDPTTNVLVTIEGNATGVTGSGAVSKDSVVKIVRNLKDCNALNKIYGVGRMSDLDFHPTPLANVATHAP